MPELWNPLEAYIQGRMQAISMQGEQQRQVLAKEEAGRRKEETAAHIKQYDALVKGETLRQAMEVHNLRQRMMHDLTSGAEPLQGFMENTPERDVSAPGGPQGIMLPASSTFHANPEQIFDLPSELGGQLKLSGAEVLSRRQQFKDQLTANMQLAATGEGMKEGAKAGAEAPFKQAEIRSTGEMHKEVARIQASTRDYERETPEQRSDREARIAHITGKYRAMARNMTSNSMDADKIAILADDLENGRVEYRPKDPNQVKARMLLSSQNRVPIPQKTYKLIGGFGNILGVIDLAEQFVNDHPDVFPKTQKSATIKKAWEATKNVIGMSEIIKDYETNIVVRAGQFAATIGAEKGPKTQKDIERALGGLTKLGDTHKRAMNEIQNVKKDLNRMLNNALTGVPSQQKEDLIKKILGEQGVLKTDEKEDVQEVETVLHNGKPISKFKDVNGVRNIYNPKRGGYEPYAPTK